LHNEFKVLDIPYINRIYENNHDKIIAYSRSNLLFVFNFNPTTSFTDYGIPVKSKFRIVLDTDDPAFGGFDRIDRKALYASIRKAERQTLSIPYYLYLYLPSRTAIVLKQEATKKAIDI